MSKVFNIINASSASFNSIGSFIFDGVNERISLGDSDTLSFGNGTTDNPVSFSAWVYMNNTSSFRIISKSDGFTSQEYIFSTSGGSDLILLLYDNGDNNRIGRITTTDLTAYQNTWVNVIGTYSGNGSNTGIKLYVAGVNQSVTSLNLGTYTAMHNTVAPAYIGYFDTTSDYADGNISNVTIIGKELSQLEVDEINSTGSPINPNSFSFVGDIVSHYRLDQTDDPTTIVNDVIGSNNGTPVNMTSSNLDLVNFP